MLIAMFVRLSNVGECCLQTLVLGLSVISLLPQCLDQRGDVLPVNHQSPVGGVQIVEFSHLGLQVRVLGFENVKLSHLMPLTLDTVPRPATRVGLTSTGSGRTVSPMCESHFPKLD